MNDTKTSLLSYKANDYSVVSSELYRRWLFYPRLKPWVKSKSAFSAPGRLLKTKLTAMLVRGEIIRISPLAQGLDSFVLSSLRELYCVQLTVMHNQAHAGLKPATLPFIPRIGKINKIAKLISFYPLNMLYISLKISIFISK